MNRSIFISHSATHDPATQRVCDLLIPELEKQGYDVYFDRNITPDDYWRHRLSIWMALCDAAIMLFSDAALQSEWVRTEATIFKWRRDLEPNFVLLPVRLPEFNIDNVQTSPLSTLGITDIQFVGRAPGLTEESLVSLIVTGIQSTLGQPSDGPLRWIEEFLTGNLEPVKNQAKDILIAKKATLFPSTSIPYTQQLARLLLQLTLEEVADVFDMIGKSALPSNVFETIIDILFPFWVNPEAAAALAQIAQSQDSDRLAVINTMSTKTIKSYVWRAYCKKTPWPLIEAGPTGELSVEGAFVQVAYSLLKDHPLWSATSTSQNEMLMQKYLQRRKEKDTWPLFVTVPLSNIDFFKALYKRLYPCTIVATLTENTTLNSITCQKNGISWIEPELDADVEMSIGFAYVDALERAGVTINDH